MIKVYFDWNVLSQMKNGSFPELKKAIEADENLFIPFSTSHINDLTSGFQDTPKQRGYVKSDLEFISSITNDYCLFINGENVVLDLYSPTDLFWQNIRNKDAFTDISIDGLMTHFEDAGIKRLVEPFMNILKAIPLDDAFKQAFENPEASTSLEKMFPGLKENQTLGGVFESLSKMNFNLNELEGYKDLREIVQSGLEINRDRIFDLENPFEAIQESHEKYGISIAQFLPETKYGSKWFNSICDEYLQLDMHGYQEDKVTIRKRRKETFKNTTEDAFHAAFASTCNFYVINDRRSSKKVKKVYEKLNINTRVFTPEEFVDFYQKFLSNQNPETDIRLIDYVLRSGNSNDSQTTEGLYKIFELPCFLFGFFNRIVCLFHTDRSMGISRLLSQNKPTKYFVIAQEVELLVRKLTTCFGTDIDNTGELQDGEFNNDFWEGRKWRFKDLILQLITVNGHVQLYWYQAEK